jgi:hypothetical protein
MSVVRLRLRGSAAVRAGVDNLMWRLISYLIAGLFLTMFFAMLPFILWSFRKPILIGDYRVGVTDYSDPSRMFRVRVSSLVSARMTYSNPSLSTDDANFFHHHFRTPLVGISDSPYLVAESGIPFRIASWRYIHLPQQSARNATMWLQHGHSGGGLPPGKIEFFWGSVAGSIVVWGLFSWSVSYLACRCIATRYRRRRLCVNCEYSVVGLITDRCPECGQSLQSRTGLPETPVSFASKSAPHVDSPASRDQRDPDLQRGERDRLAGGQFGDQEPGV